MSGVVSELETAIHELLTPAEAETARGNGRGSSVPATAGAEAAGG
jgi:hypothetical protein